MSHQAVQKKAWTWAAVWALVWPWTFGPSVLYTTGAFEVSSGCAVWVCVMDAWGAIGVAECELEWELEWEFKVFAMSG